jgi:hypothetical protein
MTKTSGRLVLAALAAAWALLAPVARAEESCALRGDVVVPKGVAISDSAGTDIAQFTGAKIAISVSGFPSSGSARAKIQTVGFRVEGYVRAREIPVYTMRSVPAYAGHVWIGEGRRVSIIGSAPGKLHVEKSVTSPVNGTFHGWAPCDAFTLTERVPPGWTPPGSARGYVLRRDRIDLHSSEQGDVVTSLERGGDGAGLLLWSTDRSGSWIHVEHHSDIVLDGWVRASDVNPLPEGETMDQLAPSPIQHGAPTLNIQGQPKIVHVDRTVALRAAASDAAGTIGGIDPGTDVMLMDIVAGWASVLPKGLGVSPMGTNQFWVRAKDIGL